MGSKPLPKTLKVISTKKPAIYIKDQAMVLRESIPRQVDKKPGIPEEEKAVWGSQRGDKDLELSRRKKEQTSFSFSSIFLSLSHIKHFFL